MGTKRGLRKRWRSSQQKILASSASKWKAPQPRTILAILLMNLQLVAHPVFSPCRHQSLCHLGREQGSNTMEKTQVSEVLIITRVRKMKVNCNSISSSQAAINPCSCPHGNPTLGTGGICGDTLLRL